MKRNNLLTILSTAVGTATLTVATLFTGSSEAGGEGGEMPATIAVPKLLVNGVETTLTRLEPTSKGSTPAEGAPPRFMLKAVNTTDRPAKVALRLSMRSSSLPDALSRTVALPAEIWKQEQFLTLKPNETFEKTISPDTVLSAKGNISVWMQEAGKAAPSLAVFTLTETNLPAPARARGAGLVAFEFATSPSPAAADQLTAGRISTAHH